jgi:hypothetical protein
MEKARDQSDAAQGDFFRVCRPAKWAVGAVSKNVSKGVGTVLGRVAVVLGFDSIVKLGIFRAENALEATDSDPHSRL